MCIFKHSVVIAARQSVPVIVLGQQHRHNMIAIWQVTSIELNVNRYSNKVNKTVNRPCGAPHCHFWHLLYVTIDFFCFKIVGINKFLDSLAKPESFTMLCVLGEMPSPVLSRHVSWVIRSVLTAVGDGGVVLWHFPRDGGAAEIERSAKAHYPGSDIDVLSLLITSDNFINSFIVCQSSLGRG